jgi:high-affinity iron transporter
LFPSYLLGLREGLEIALIIGIVLGAIRKFNKPELTRPVWLGAAAAALLSLTAAVFLHLVGANLEEPYEQIFEGSLYLLAAAVLTWMIFWMQRQARTIQGQIAGEARLAALQTGSRALFLLAFLSVAREGLELAILFTAAAFSTGQTQAAIGALFGLACAALLGWALFTASLRMNLQRFFLITSLFLILFAAGLVAQGVHEFNEIGAIPNIVAQLWDSSRLVTAESTAGITLKTLFGYTPTPSLSAFVAYLTYFAVVGFGFWANRPKTSEAEPVSH